MSAVKMSKCARWSKFWVKFWDMEKAEKFTYLTLSAQFPEEFVILELLSLVWYYTWHGRSQNRRCFTISTPHDRSHHYISYWLSEIVKSRVVLSSNSLTNRLMSCNLILSQSTNQKLAYKSIPSFTETSIYGYARLFSEDHVITSCNSLYGICKQYHAANWQMSICFVFMKFTSQN